MRLLGGLRLTHPQSVNTGILVGCQSEAATWKHYVTNSIYSTTNITHCHPSAAINTTVIELFNSCLLSHRQFFLIRPHLHLCHSIFFPKTRPICKFCFKADGTVKPTAAIGKNSPGMKWDKTRAWCLVNKTGTKHPLLL